MNAGDSIVEKLKENKSLGWQFVSEEKAKEGVQAGDYYAAIVIPENFSSSLVSIMKMRRRIQLLPRLRIQQKERCRQVLMKSL